MSWQAIRGHDAQRAAFAEIVRRGKLAHAYLFVGPDGIGKRMFAVELARGLSCERASASNTLDACGQCPACVQIAAGTYPDLDLLSLPEEKQEFPVELMQAFLQRISVKPVHARRRIAIIDDADSFNEESANCFLKTLEEPPPHSLVILLSPTTTQLLPTIVSRCQTVRFAPLDQESVATLLQEHHLVASPEQARQIAALAEGSLGQARLLASAEVLKFQEELLAALGASSFSGVTWAERINKFVEEAGKDSAAKRQRAALVVRLLLNTFRAALWSCTQPQEASRSAPCVPYLAQKLGQIRLLELLDRCLETDWMIQRRVQLVLVLEALADQLGHYLRAA